MLRYRENIEFYSISRKLQELIVYFIMLFPCYSCVLTTRPIIYSFYFIFHHNLFKKIYEIISLFYGHIENALDKVMLSF